MRPEILFPLFAEIVTLNGVGPKLGKTLEQLGITRVVDLLFHAPSGVVKRPRLKNSQELENGKIATLKVMVDAHLPALKGPYKIRCHDDVGFVQLVFFHPNPAFLQKSAPVGREIWVSGKCEFFNNEPQITHPDYMTSELENIPEFEQVYPLTAGLSLKVLHKILKEALKLLPDMPEWQDNALLGQKKWPSFKESLISLHSGTGIPDKESLPRQRLAYDELLANQLALGLVRGKVHSLRGRSLETQGELRKKALAIIPFELTRAQKRCLEEIYQDLAASTRMLRLLQGDVGSGKTIIAFLTMLEAVEAGGQAAIMAPTEILARQHLAAIEPLAAQLGIKVELLLGQGHGSRKKDIFARIASGETQIVIGTHALLQQGVEFRDLYLVVIDEQHRFGVHQRLGLAAKGRAVDMLVMTATPIPRTLMLTLYGDMEVSRLDEKPAGRKPIDTKVIPASRIEEVIGGLQRALAGGAKIYWVCPLVEESENIDLAAAVERFEDLEKYFGAKVGLVHGRLKGREKAAVMEAFVNGPIDILVATTVIEVGVNVPAATVMVIEHAERFGLAQLHQLRGRIGRGEAKSTCLLLYSGPLGKVAKARLEIMRATEDGFLIAEEDLRLRGGGELLGIRQSGMPEFKLADFGAHMGLMGVAHGEARLILNKNPELDGERGKALRMLLYLFERDEAAKTLRAG